MDTPEAPCSSEGSLLRQPVEGDWDKGKLRDQIFKATGIGVGYLEGWAPILSASIAQHTSWMATEGR